MSGAPLLHLAGDGPLLMLGPANGFPPAAYGPLSARLGARYRVAALPPRALWPGQPAPTPASTPRDWGALAEDLLDGLSRHGLPPVVAVGHSFSAVAALLAAIRAPHRFRALALLDPTILPPEVMRDAQARRRRGEPMRFSLVERALQRRDRFSSAAEAFTYWRDKPLFADWPDAALEAYVTAMLTPDEGGAGFRLTWAPAWEAAYYASFHADTWEELPALAPTLPVLVVRGERSDTFLAPAADRLREVRPGAEVVTLPDAGHLFPLAAPERTAEVLLPWLDRLAPLPVS